jgi:flagellar biosynthetic protein FliP
LQPYMKQQITQAQFFQKAGEPIKEFMLRQTRDKDLNLFIKLGRVERPESRRKVPFWVILPAFVISEIKTAFEIGFVIYLPFLVIDMVVASVLMSMGMFMLSPMSISLPFKLLLFVMIDGWNMIVDGLVKSFK